MNTEHVDTGADGEKVSDLFEILGITTKAVLADHCRTAVVTGEDLANLIWAASAGAVPVRHLPIFRHHHPSHLALTDEDLKTMAGAEVGPLEGTIRKPFRKAVQMFEERRMFCGHMFWCPDLPGVWHLIYFDQRDISASDSHWEHGSHVHLMNWLTHPRLDPNALLKQLQGVERPKLGGSIHVRYVR